MYIHDSAHFMLFRLTKISNFPGISAKQTAHFIHATQQNWWSLNVYKKNGTAKCRREMKRGGIRTKYFFFLRPFHNMHLGRCFLCEKEDWSTRSNENSCGYANILHDIDNDWNRTESNIRLICIWGGQKYQWCLCNSNYNMIFLGCVLYARLELVIFI